MSLIHIHKAQKSRHKDCLAFATITIGAITIQGAQVQLSQSGVKIQLPQPKTARALPTYKLNPQLSQEIALAILQEANRNELIPCA